MVQNYRDSGLSAARWCNDNQIKLSNLRYWIGRFRHDNHSVSGSFMEYHPESTSMPISVLVGEFRIELTAGFDPLAFKEAVFLLKNL